MKFIRACPLIQRIALAIALLTFFFLTGCRSAYGPMLIQIGLPGHSFAPQDAVTDQEVKGTTLGFGVSHHQNLLIRMNQTDYLFNHMLAPVEHPDMLTLTSGYFSEFRWNTALLIEHRHTLDQINQLLQRAVPDPALFCMLRLDGRFLDLQLTAADGTPRARLQDTKGTLIGVRIPDAPGKDTPSFIYVFLAENRRTGGRVHSALVQTGTLQLDVQRRRMTILPDTFLP